jgi:hypothetical protein
MPSPRALIGGLVQRFLPSPTVDDGDVDKPVRLGRYREPYGLSLVRKSHLLADEGSYFVTNNGQAAIASVLAASFVATTPLVTISNTDTVAASSKRIYLDFVNLVTGTAGAWASAGVNVQVAVYIDALERYSSGGTDLTSLIVSPNMDVPSKSVAKVRFGNITATAASGSVRAVVGTRIIRAAVSATVADVTGEQKYFNFGCVETMLNGSITIANANNIPVGLPPIIIGPQQCALIYYIMNGTTPSAQTFIPDIGWFER